MEQLPLSPFITFTPEEGLFRYDSSRADRVIKFIETFCVHIKGQHAGQPFILTTWQKDRIIRPLYGHVKWDEQFQVWRRQHRVAWYEVARKQGKSALLSALGLYHLVADGEQSAEVYGVAADRDQASLVFDVAKRVVQLSPHLRKHIEVIDSKKRLVFPQTNSFYQVLPGDAAGALGVNASAVLFDEVLTQRDRHLWDAMRQSFGTRTSPLMLAATTAAYTSAQFALDEHNWSLEVQADPSKDPARFVFARNLPTDWDYRIEGEPPSEAHPEGTGWYYAAPALGDFFSIEQMRDELKEVESRPQALASFRVFRLNQWTSVSERWLDMETWDANGVHKFSREDLKGRECFVGIDLASVSDFTAVVLVFPGSPTDAEADGYTVLPHFFLPRPALEKRTSMLDRFIQWRNEGYLTVTDTEVTDYEAIIEWLQVAASDFRIKLIGYDPWNSSMLIQKLEDLGATTTGVPQTSARLNDPSKLLESCLAERQLWHSGNPILRWMADNVELDVTGEGLQKPSKKKSTEKIDGIAATVTALFCALIPPDEAADVMFISAEDILREGVGGSNEDVDELLRFMASLDDD